MPNVYKPGTEVVLSRSEYVGVITGVLWKGSGISYEVAYFEHGAYTTTWLQEFELAPKEDTSKRLPIGFQDPCGSHCHEQEIDPIQEGYNYLIGRGKHNG